MGVKKKKYYYIYKITCTEGSFKDHYYIGQHITTNLDDEYKGSGHKLLKYYKKYPNDYIKEILCFCENFEELNQKEAEYIGDKYETDPMCLNLVAGGKQPGYSSELRKKLSDKHKGKPTWCKGKHLSEETKKKISESHKGKDPWNTGKHFSEESRKKMSEKAKGRISPNKGKHLSDEHRKHLSESKKGKKHKPLSEETKKKISESNKGKHKRKVPCNTGKHFSEESRKKMSEKAKGRIPWNKGKHFSDDQNKKIWISNNEHSLRIKPENFNEYEIIGYHKGRK